MIKSSVLLFLQNKIKKSKKILFSCLETGKMEMQNSLKFTQFFCRKVMLFLNYHSKEEITSNKKKPPQLLRWFCIKWKV